MCTTASEITHVTAVGQSKMALSIQARAESYFPNKEAVVLLYNEWQDDFQPLKSNKGQRKGKSVWIKTVTIIPPYGRKQNALRNTYPIAVGPKGVCHEDVENLFKKEMQELCMGGQSQYYHKESQSMKCVHAELFVSLSDQPERRSGNYVQLGNSQFHPRFGYCCDVGACKNVLPACTDCFEKLLANSQASTMTPHTNASTCDKCCCWETTSHPLLSCIPPPHYPKEMIPPSGNLEPYQLNFELLIAVVDTAHSHVISSRWTMQTARSYLRASCLSKIAIDGILDHADNIKTLLLLQENKQEQPEAFLAVCQEEALSSMLYKKWPTPSWWSRGTSISQHIEASMHLLSGVIKATVRCIQQWTACHGNMTSFLKYAENLLDPVQDLRLPWCKCPAYTGGKLPGWISEDYMMALARISKWFYSGLQEVSPDDVFEEPANLPQHKWTMKHNVGWLNARGLDTSGNAAALRDRVRGFLDLPDGPPPALAPTGGTVEEALELVFSLSSMISRLMYRTITSSLLSEVQRSIKVFLSRFARFEQKIGKRKSDDSPSWITKYNFLCLLNLPDVLQTFGPIRSLWEGGYQGQGYLRGTEPKEEELAD